MIISIWQPSLAEAHSFINQNNLDNLFVQFVPDSAMDFGYWIVFKMPESTLRSLQDARPRLTVLR